MSALYRDLVAADPDLFVVYVSTGAWNVAGVLRRFLQRNRYPSGPMLLTDWGPSEDVWFRSGQEHKRTQIARLFAELPQLSWLLVGDDGQHDVTLYGEAVENHPGRVLAVLIRELSATEQVATHGSPVRFSQRVRPGALRRAPAQASPSCGPPTGRVWARRCGRTASSCADTVPGTNPARTHAGFRSAPDPPTNSDDVRPRSKGRAPARPRRSGGGGVVDFADEHFDDVFEEQDPGGRPSSSTDVATWAPAQDAPGRPRARRRARWRPGVGCRLAGMGWSKRVRRSMTSLMCRYPTGSPASVEHVAGEAMLHDGALDVAGASRRRQGTISAMGTSTSRDLLSVNSNAPRSGSGVSMRFPRGGLLDDAGHLLEGVGAGCLVLGLDAEQPEDAVRHPVEDADDRSEDPGDHDQGRRQQQGGPARAPRTRGSWGPSRRTRRGGR